MPIALTNRIVASLDPRDRPYEVRDTKVRGLLLRVQPSGYKRGSCSGTTRSAGPSDPSGT